MIRSCRSIKNSNSNDINLDKLNIPGSKKNIDQIKSPVNKKAEKDIGQVKDPTDDKINTVIANILPNFFSQLSKAKNKTNNTVDLSAGNIGHKGKLKKEKSIITSKFSAGPSKAYELYDKIRFDNLNEQRANYDRKLVMSALQNVISKNLYGGLLNLGSANPESQNNVGNQNGHLLDIRMYNKDLQSAQKSSINEIKSPDDEMSKIQDYSKELIQNEYKTKENSQYYVNESSEFNENLFCKKPNAERGKSIIEEAEDPSALREVFNSILEASKVYKAFTNIGYKKNPRDLIKLENRIVTAYNHFYDKVNKQLGFDDYEELHEFSMNLQNGSLDKSTQPNLNNFECFSKKYNKFDVNNIKEFRDMHIRNLTDQTAFLDSNYIKRLEKYNSVAKDKIQELLKIPRPNINERCRSLPTNPRKNIARYIQNKKLDKINDTLDDLGDCKVVKNEIDNFIKQTSDIKKYVDCSSHNPMKIKAVRQENTIRENQRKATKENWEERIKNAKSNLIKTLQTEYDEKQEAKKIERLKKNKEEKSNSQEEQSHFISPKKICNKKISGHKSNKALDNNCENKGSNSNWPLDNLYEKESKKIQLELSFKKDGRQSNLDTIGRRASMTSPTNKSKNVKAHHRSITQPVSISVSKPHTRRHISTQLCDESNSLTTKTMNTITQKKQSQINFSNIEIIPKLPQKINLEKIRRLSSKSKETININENLYNVDSSPEEKQVPANIELPKGVGFTGKVNNENMFIKITHLKK